MTIILRRWQEVALDFRSIFINIIASVYHSGMELSINTIDLSVKGHSLCGVEDLKDR